LIRTPSDFESESATVFGPRVRRVYAAHAMASIGSNLLLPSFFFYAKQIFGWGMERSLALVSAEGAVYLFGALLAETLARAFGRRRSLLAIHSILVLVAAAAWVRPTPVLVVVVLLAYTFISAAGWPLFESLIAAGAGADTLSRRMGLYNLIWSSIGAVTLAVSGTIIARFPWGMFFVPMVAHFVAILLLSTRKIEPPAAASAVHAAAEPQLLAQRRLALHLSRIGLPAVYTVVYSLVALMPSLHVIQSFSPENQTIVASTWMATRFVAFLILGTAAWWHTRPRLLLWAVAVMLVAFLGVTLRLADFSSAASPVTELDRMLMIAWQIPLGFSMGLIYTASLYFGMVLSDGSTAQGGHHEALIGLGQVIGPGAALVAQRGVIGNPLPAIGAIAALLLISLVAAGIITKRHASRSG
jgi:MFS family permease